MASGSLAKSSCSTSYTPPGFTPVVHSKLNVVYSDLPSPIEPGSAHVRAELVPQPSLALEHNVAKKDQTYLGILVDLDLILSADAPSTKLLHWVAQDLILEPGSEHGLSSLTNTTANAGFYIEPQPPANQTHRYVFLAYEQPKNFKIPNGTDYNADVPNSRFYFDIDAFTKDAGLGVPVAANWISVTGS